MYLFSSDIERDAAFPDGMPAGVVSAIVGVGLVEAGIGAARAVAEHRPARAVFIGTCGAHAGSGLAIGDVVVATSAVLSSGDVARGQMRVPSLLCAELETSAELNAMLVDRARAQGIELKPARVSCTIGVTEDAGLAALLQHDGAVENLEVFSVVRAVDVPVTAVLGVTNIVGPGGGRDWAANFRDMMRRSALCVVRSAF